MTKKLIHEKDLPAPRLELRWQSKDRWQSGQCDYALVLPLRPNDVRRQQVADDGAEIDRETLTVLLGMTDSDMAGRPPISGEEIRVPFRDGAHAIWDSRPLGGLPIYAVCEGRAMEVKVDRPSALRGRQQIETAMAQSVRLMVTFDVMDYGLFEPRDLERAVQVAVKHRFFDAGVTRMDDDSTEVSDRFDVKLVDVQPVRLPAPATAI